MIGVGVDGLYHHVTVQEVGSNDVGHEGRVLLLEDDGHNVVADVPLLLQLWAWTQQMELIETESLFPCHFSSLCVCVCMCVGVCSSFNKLVEFWCG